MNRARLALGLLPLTLLGRPAAAQAPAGPEFVVNVSTAGGQGRPALGMDAAGNFVVAWQSTHQGGSYNVFAQRFDAAGVRRGGEFRVNTYTTGEQYGSDVAVDGRGDFVVTWSHAGDVFAQRFANTGAAAGAEFRVNSYTIGYQVEPVVAADTAGNFVVAWASMGQDGSNYGVFGRRFDAGGAPLGAEFRVNSTTAGSQYEPDVAFTADGGFVVVWTGPDASGTGVWGQRFAASGTPAGGEFAVPTAARAQATPVVAALPPGGFVVAWTAALQDLSSNAVLARIFNAAGSPVTGELAVNTYTINNQNYPVVAADGLGNFVVAWTSFGQDGSAEGVFGQRFDAAGAHWGAEFAINTYTTLAQRDAALGTDSAGNFVVAWGSATGDGYAGAVMGRRFQGLLPVALAVDSQGDGVMEANETATFTPSWRNATTATQTFTGTLSNFTGPQPANYNIPDTAANYGPTPAGAVHSCNDGSNCYALTLTATTRPAAHWDATVLETLAGPPATVGLQKRWLVHVGGSFSDVSRTSAFYPFIETLFHHGITGGCTTTTYCPATATTRDAMAVFVLVAREGSGYLPPACATPVFTDVPASSGFCRWVEELARRGVVGGCGGGNYCPGDPVTREQMPIFVLRALDGALNPPACTTPMFADVPASSPFCRWIEELARRGVVSGCGGGNYCPAAAVTREQMGVFISVTFGLSLYGG